jgi:hypothetical protein
MSMCHAPIKRTFHRVARDGRVKCDNRLWEVRDQDGELYSGPVIMRVNINNPHAEMKGQSWPLLEVSEMRGCPACQNTWPSNEAVSCPDCGEDGALYLDQWKSK